MPKKKVILTANVESLGSEADTVEVAPGFARNYLIPQGLAIPVTRSNARQMEVLQQRRAEREGHELAGAEELAKGVSKLVLLIKVRTGDDGKMFGSVTSAMILDELAHQFDVHLTKKQVHLSDPIRHTGDHDVELRLHTDVTCTLNVRAESVSLAPDTAEVGSASHA
ncbi:MAG: large subunit ribosomal protein L9 [Candidatus Binatia bacterium]|jgi:large subunit ribosomal protein L9